MKKWKWLHRWFSLVLGFFLILWAVSGIVLNHRELVSSVEVDRKLLPSEYHFENWNNAAVRSGLELDSGMMLLYGNIGIWLTDTTFSYYTPFMDGFPKGVDNARTMKLLRSDAGQLFAATQSGLYVKSSNDALWNNIPLPHHDARIMDMTLKNDSLFVVDRSNIYIFKFQPQVALLSKIQLLPAFNDDNKIGLFRTLWVIHSGEVLGFAGKLLVDFLALVLIFLIVTGYIYFFFPRWIKRRKKHQMAVSKHVATTKFSVKWHNKIGIWIGGFLILTVFTGMFLRPPLLITISQARVAKIPGTILNHPNVWHDRLRALVFDATSGGWMLGTNDGIFSVDAQFSQKPQPIGATPPLSVMGINVFEPLENGYFLIGSFNGLFLWEPNSGFVRDFITGQTPQVRSSAGSPIGQHLISGMFKMNGKSYIFEYNQGLLSEKMDMPQTIENTPMPLWNVALEVHTARIFQSTIGAFYLLIIPLLGLMTLLILISGILIYLKKRKKMR